MTPFQAITDLARATGAGRLEDGTVELYLREVAGMDSRDVEHGCRELARTSTWFPKLADVLHAVAVAKERRIALTFNQDSPEQRTMSCRMCEDVGYTLEQCSGNSQRSCGRGPEKYDVTDPVTGKYSHTIGSCKYPHAYARDCSCRRRKIAQFKNKSTS